MDYSKLSQYINKNDMSKKYVRVSKMYVVMSKKYVMFIYNKNYL